MGILTDTTHLHITTWVVAVILFLVAAFMQRDSKGRKIMHMVLRLFYVLIIITGLTLFIEWSSADPMLYGIKFLLGVLTIGMMEMVLVRSKKQKSVTMFWALFAVFLFATMFIGFMLPVGMDFF
ncbi:MAG: YisL family protein [Planococcus sp. (in: firmicutes)]|uniref:YisL family protein n=1 Tax=Planococcus halocryophilus TaxID=1215089 RepID=UPI001F0FA1DB|nr:YisL family protein [Planococcus halocryophilus]MCH4824794.1 YisL family protein [Planococcus halocryophilus]